jgi:hypothetical protein
VPQFGSFSLEPSGYTSTKAYRHGSSHSGYAINRTCPKRVLASHHALDVTAATDASVGSSAVKRQGPCRPRRLHIIPGGDYGPERWSLPTALAATQVRAWCRRIGLHRTKIFDRACCPRQAGVEELAHDPGPRCRTGEPRTTPTTRLPPRTTETATLNPQAQT